MIDEKEIAVITCVNDTFEYEEALYYIEQLEIPKGYKVDIIAIQDAEAMAEGYQAAMKSSDAKYKIYMHQDVFICNKKFLKNIIEIFEHDKSIGLIGMVGRKVLPEKLLLAAEWDTGNIHFNNGNIKMESKNNKNPIEVEAVDGLLLVTQYDVDWRSDLFNGWDFYDISQCEEFRRKGYKVVVPYQGETWCDHDNTYSKLENYFYYQQVFCKEYQDIKKFENLVFTDKYKELEIVLQQMKKQMEQMVNEQKRDELWDMFVQMNGKVHLGLQEFYLLAQIDHLEEINAEQMKFWTDGVFWSQLRSKIRKLKFQLKRIEYGYEDEKEIEQLYKYNSVYAIILIMLEYTPDRKACIRKMAKLHDTWSLQEQWNVWDKIAQVKGIL